ncbi:MAG: hypothetical protein AB7L66_05175 [Gemmatimonadales bacterium]
MAGGILGLALAPVMVTIKYMTGWNIIPEPGWVGGFQAGLGGLLRFAPPPVLWTAYGTGYTVALLLLLAGLVGLIVEVRRHHGRVPTRGLWVMVVGFAMVIPGDAIHSWTWHQHGLTTPTPGTNPLANTAYAVHMMGMNLVMIGAVWSGVASLRRKLLARWLAWGLVLVFPAALVASVGFLPTTPSGALWWFCVPMLLAGAIMAKGEAGRLTAAGAAPS